MSVVVRFHHHGTPPERPNQQQESLYNSYFFWNSLPPLLHTLRFGGMCLLFFCGILQTALEHVMWVYTARTCWYVASVLWVVCVDKKKVNEALDKAVLFLFGDTTKTKTTTTKHKKHKKKKHNDWIGLCWDRVVAAAHWIDFHILFGNRWSGREWSPMDVSFGKTLWELPPPSIFKQGKRLCLDPHQLFHIMMTMSNSSSNDHATDDDDGTGSSSTNGLGGGGGGYFYPFYWSRPTVNHRVAIHFCYVMIREDHLLKQAAEQQQKQQPLLLNSTGTNKLELAQQSKNRPRPMLLGRANSSLYVTAQEDALSLNKMKRSHSLGALDGICDNYEDEEEDDDDDYHHPTATASVAVVVDNGTESCTSTLGQQHQQRPRRRKHGLRLELRDVAAVASRREGGEDDVYDYYNDDGTNDMPRSGSAEGLSDDDFATTSSVASADCVDMPWIDVGAQIGMRLLNSAHVHRAITDPLLISKLEERTRPLTHHLQPQQQNQQSQPDSLNPGSDHSWSSSTSPFRSSSIYKQQQPQHQRPTKLKVDRLPKPVHSMWTSPSAAAAAASPTPSFQSEAAGEAFDNCSPPASPTSVRKDKILALPSMNDFNNQKSGVFPPPPSPQRSLASEPPSPRSLAGASGSSTATQRLNLHRHQRHHHRHQSPPENSISNSNSIEVQLQHQPSSYSPAMSSFSATSFKKQHHKSSAMSTIPVTQQPVRMVNNFSKTTRAPTQMTSVVVSDTTIATVPSFHAREPLLPGVKVAVPIFPIQPTSQGLNNTGSSRGTSVRHSAGTRRASAATTVKRIQNSFQMGTVVRSRRIYVGNDEDDKSIEKMPNCLSVTVKLDKAYLRNAEFAELTFRVMDEWTSGSSSGTSSSSSSNKSSIRSSASGASTSKRTSSCCYMPRHSKVPIGSCVATTFGLGVVVGWRVQDECHVVRSLWQRRGKGTAHAYLQPSAIYSTVEAAVGFEVHTKYGWGDTLAYVDGGKTFESGRFFVAMKEDGGRYHGHVLELHRKDIYSCLGAQFIPIIEHIREAAHYKIQMDNYEAALREQNYDDSNQMQLDDERLWKAWSACLDILWNSFLKAVKEDADFDEGLNECMTSIIEFLERLDEAETTDTEEAAQQGLNSTDELAASDFEVECYMSDAGGTEGDYPVKQKEKEAPGFWVINDLLGGVFRPHAKDLYDEHLEPPPHAPPTDEQPDKKPAYYDRAFAVLRTVMKTVSLAKAESVDHPHFRLALAITYDFLLFIRTIVKVQQKNHSVHSLEVWKKAFEEIALTFGPLKERLEKIGRGIAQRMEKQGRRAKTRVLRFVDTILGDERLLFAMEQGEWDQCISRLETALVKSKIIQEQSLFYYRKTGQFIYDHLKASISNGGGAAARNNEKLALLAQALRSIASPRRSTLKIFLHSDVLELFERILVRVYCREEQASRILTIHASNFHSLRHLRLLKDFSVAGKIWIPLLDAADEEFSWVVSQLPENSKDFMCPLSSLFSLCVAQFHKINDGDLSKDWLDFLLEDDAARIIQDIDMKLILALESFSRDVREMMEVLPYYPSIDDDILKLMDEVNLDEFLKEASTAIDDPDSLSQFLREKVTIAIERFLNYLPRMSIPVERRELGDGWVLTCRGADGSDLTLSDVKVKRENLVCQILGGDSLFFPMFGEDDGSVVTSWSDSLPPSPARCEPTYSQGEESILDHIRGLLLQAQSYGCWKSGVGGVGEPPSDRYVAAVLHGLPVSSVLNCAIELWRNLEIDDDELLEIAIRDVSYQIQLQKEREEGAGVDAQQRGPRPMPAMTAFTDSSDVKQKATSSFDSVRRRFNPRIDPTVLFLEMKNLNLHLDNFLFRIEKSQKRTLFDPVFEGRGMVSLQNINIRLRVECAKERVKRSKAGCEVSAPILQVQELVVELDNMQLRVKDTGFGSDWLLNHAVQVFAENITSVVEENLRDQILEQSRSAIDNLNAYFSVNPNMLLNLLGISMDDLEENVVYV